MKLPPPRPRHQSNLRVSVALKGLLFSALVAFGAAHAATQVVFLSTDESVRESEGNNYPIDQIRFVENPRSVFEAEAKRRGYKFENMANTLNASKPALTDEQKGEIEKSDIVVIVTTYNPVGSDKFEFLEGLMKQTNPDRPQTFIIVTDGCCSVDANFNKFAGAVKDMAGWGAEAELKASIGGGTIDFPLNEYSPYAYAFRSLNPLGGGAFGYIANVPRDLALYTVPDTADPAPPAPADGKAHAYGLFLPVAQANGGACTFLVGDASIFSVSDNTGYYQTAPFAEAFLNAAAANEGGACNTPTFTPQEQCDEGCDPDNPGAQDPDPANPGVKLGIAPIDLTCSAADADKRVAKSVTFTTDKYWSVKGATATGLGAGEWFRPHEPEQSEWYLQGAAGGWADAESTLDGAKWITPGQAADTPPTTPDINTEGAYLFARAVRVGQLAAGESVQVKSARYLADNRVNAAWVGGKDAEVNTDLYTLRDNRTVDWDRSTSLLDRSSFTAAEELDASPLAFEGGKTNWLIFQVKNSEQWHEVRNPTGFAASVELAATLDCSANCASGIFDANGVCQPPLCTEGQAIAEGCTCVAPMADDGGICATPVAPVCAPPSGCSSAPAAQWPALLGLGALLPLAVRRRRRK